MSSCREPSRGRRLARAAASTFAALGVLGVLGATTVGVAAPAGGSPAASSPARATRAGATVPAYVGIGRAATPAEVAAWDIDVRPDFRGLPPGRGSVAEGEKVWEAKCASCHGVFGESNQVFTPLVGGTTAEDIRTGRVAALAPGAYPGRTTLMKAPYVATLWDFIRRAMPWNAPKTLTDDEVYATTAYLLNLGGVVADDFVLSERNIAQVQSRMPNRAGMRTDHAMWPGKGFGIATPDTRNTACMRDCAVDVKVASSLPDHAQGAHGDLAQQVRDLRGARRTGAAPGPAAVVSPAAAAVAPVAAAASAGSPAAAPTITGAAAQALLQKHGCVGCHQRDTRLVGPSFREIAAKVGGQPDGAARLQASIRQGSSGLWGPIPMPPQAIAEADIAALAGWIHGGAR